MEQEIKSVYCECGRGIGFWTGPDESPCNCYRYTEEYKLAEQELKDKLADLDDRAFEKHLRAHTDDANADLILKSVGMMA